MLHPHHTAPTTQTISQNTMTQQPAHIPPFAKQLAPYIKSRQEALRIRQLLTAHLRSHLTFADDDPDLPDQHAQSHLALCVPQDAVVGVKRVSSEVAGLRREYLLALQANLDAKREYREVAEGNGGGGVAEKGNGNGNGERRGDPTGDLQGYLRLLRDRRRHSKLQVFGDYLGRLGGRDEGSLLVGSGGGDVRGAGGMEDLEGEDKADGGGGGEGVEELVHKLERAVIRAKAQLDRERALLEELKAQQDGQEDVAPAVKLRALQRTRDELVQWVEEKLVSVGNSDDGPMQELLPAEQIEESARQLEEQKALIAEQYGAYVDARKRLLDAASRACQPIANAPAKPPDRSIDQNKTTAEDLPALDPVEVLSFASEILLPLSKSQRALAMQKFYLAGLLSKEKNTALRILNRLSDESHLLPEYPILARQPRFKHAAAAINSRSAVNPTEMSKPDEVVSVVEAWAFASDAAGSNEQEYVEHKVEEGSATAQDAKQVLQEVYDMLNQDLEEVLRDGSAEEQDGDDIWAKEARSTRSRVQASRGEKQRPKGPWSGLSGKVGAAD